MNITVCICTWNRARLLRQTLESLTQLKVPADVQWDLLIVNNNCTDETDAVVSEFQGRLPIVSEKEPTPGKSYALNRALSVASGDWIVFTDDDVLVAEDWLAVYAAAALSAPEPVAFLGGGVEPWFESPPPAAMAAALPSVRTGFCGIKIPERREIDRPDNAFPMGANLAMRVSSLKGRKFDVRLGPTGKSHVTAEEWQMMRELLAAGYSGRWVPGAEVRHYVPHERLTMKALFRFYFGLGCATVLVEGVPPGRRLLGVPCWIVRSLLQKVALLPGKYWFGNGESYYRDFAAIGSLSGRLWQCWKVRNTACG